MSVPVIVTVTRLVAIGPDSADVLDVTAPVATPVTRPLIVAPRELRLDDGDVGEAPSDPQAMETAARRVNARGTE
jgi:hypothetical protein